MTFTNRLEIGPECFEIFLTSDALPEMPLYGIHMAGIAHLKPPYIVERTDPSLNTLLFTSSGRGKLITAQGELPIVPETMAVIPTGAGFRFEIDAPHWDMCWILLPDTPRWQALMPERAEVRATQQALNIFHLSHVIDQERHLASVFRQASFSQFSRYLQLNLKSQETEQQDRLTAALAQIEQALHKPWTVADMAQLTFYSEAHLFRLCRQRYGKGPKQLIRDLRLERARQLLAQTDWPLAELAMRLGFSDQFNFSNWFKKSEGASPLVFRQQAHAARGQRPDPQ